MGVEMEYQNLEGRHLILSHLIDQAGIGYVEIDTRFCITLWSKGAEHLLGHSPNAVLGRRLDEIIALDVNELYQDDISGTTIFFHVNDQKRSLQCQVHYLSIIESNGENLGTALLVKEIRAGRDEYLRSSPKARANSMDDLLGFAPVGIFHAELDGNLVMANSESAWMLGYESSTLLVQAVDDFAGQVFYDEKKAEEFMFILMEAERITRFRCRLRRNDDTPVWALFYAMITVDSQGRVNGFNGYAIDIGDTIRAENGLKKANDELMRLSVIDSLTQIPNRRQFDINLNKSWHRQMESGRPLSVILCDIDHFKLYNDRYGHQAGDECLKQVARAIDAGAREDRGLAARYGGEEFAVILDNEDRAQAVAVAEKIRARVLSLGIEHKLSNTHAHITLSLGTATRIPRKPGADTGLVSLADKALYKAKKQGRNQVVSG